MVRLFCQSCGGGSDAFYNTYLAGAGKEKSLEFLTHALTEVRMSKDMRDIHGCVFGSKLNAGNGIVHSDAAK